MARDFPNMGCPGRGSNTPILDPYFGPPFEHLPGGPDPGSPMRQFKSTPFWSPFCQDLLKKGSKIGPYLEPQMAGFGPLFEPKYDGNPPCFRVSLNHIWLL